MGRWLLQDVLTGAHGSLSAPQALISPKKVARQQSPQPLSSVPVWAEPSQLLLGNWEVEIAHR